MPEVLLIDNPEEGIVESWGWVSTDVGEDAAREALREFVYSEDGSVNALPTGPASIAWYRLENPGAHYEDQRWKACAPTDDGAREFWQIDCTETAAETQTGGPDADA